MQQIELFLLDADMKDLGKIEGKHKFFHNFVPVGAYGFFYPLAHKQISHVNPFFSYMALINYFVKSQICVLSNFICTL